MNTIFKLAGTICVGVFVSIFRAFVISKMWGWFVTPVFEIKVPDLYLIIGLELIVNLLKYNNTSDKSLAVITVDSITKSSIILFLGWIIWALFA